MIYIMSKIRAKITKARKPATTYHVVTLFPEVVEAYASSSILGRAREKGLIDVRYYNPRDFAEAPARPDRIRSGMTYQDRRVDGRPYGGGPGMVIEALPVIKAIDAAVGKKMQKRKAKSKNGASAVKIIFFSPSGEQFTNETAVSFKKYADIVVVCGRYEGIDARVKKAFPMTDVSVGPFVLTGGEVPAMIIIDSVTRRIPGVLGHHTSVEENRDGVASPDVYTRPEAISFKKKEYCVPKVLLSGNHAEMDEWKRRKLGSNKK